ncbi:hypothetical protein KJF94_15995 [Pseudomonas hormoni]|uniref:Bacteriophage T7 tail fibre protein-like N-terminal domain-containing protein n=1 Tax=Pseudomonas hormoni TaxID=3093767 RepID=A0ABX8EQ88_9PSED|nr:phage tail fiber protein [Pseudomonas hormoni]QVW21415.1 hypothetical protein KJF94_15995 [Pseudomonas hormoni]
MAAPKTVLTYPLDGSRKDFDVPFEYLARKFVVVTLVGATRRVLAVTSEYRFATKKTITTTAAWGPGDGFDSLEIRRITSATERLVDFSDGSVLRAYDLNTAQVQSLHIAEEARDLTADTIAVNNDGDLDARGRGLVNLRDGVQPGDAVTVRQQLANSESAMASAVRAKTSEDNAKVSETTAVGAASTASTKALAAAEDAEKARLSQVASKSSEDNAKSYRDSALTYKDSALDSKDKAKVSEDHAKASELAAKNSELSAASAGVQLGMTMWGHRPQPFQGFALDDGQELDKSLFPDFVAALTAGLFPTVSEATWQADPSKRGCFVLTSSTGKFRMRDLNGISAGSLGANFLRGGNDAATVIKKDQLQGSQLTGSPGWVLAEFPTYASAPSTLSNLRGAFMTPKANKFADTTLLTVGSDGANGTPRIGSETYPTHATGAWMTRLFGIVTPLGSAEAASLATAYASLASRATALETRATALEAVPKIKRWTSANIVLTSGATQYSHGLGVMPDIVTIRATLKSSQLGWAAGSVFKFPAYAGDYGGGSTTYGSQVGAITASSFWINGGVTGVFIMGTTGQVGTLIQSVFDWNVELLAWA